MKRPVLSKLTRFEPPPPSDDWQWDTVRCSQIGSDAIIRHRLVLHPEHIGILTPSLGLIGHHDLGRELVVDVHRDGETIDIIHDAPLPNADDEMRTRIIEHVHRAITKYKAVLAEMGVPTT